MQPVYLICGVPGSGKTWIASQIAKKFSYLPHDEYATADYGKAILAMAAMSDKPILAECPFRMKVLIEELEAEGVKVHSYFIKEDEQTIAQRYEAREGKPIPKQHLSNYRRLIADKREWKVGSQNEILGILKAA
jgi:gluconate kinase